MELHEKIRTLRVKRGLSQKQLASTIGVSDKTISKWECARGNIGLKELEKLAEALGVHTDDLLPTKVAEGKEFAPRRIQPDLIFRAAFVAAMALLLAATAWMGVLTAKNLNIDEFVLGWCHIAVGGLWIIAAVILLIIKFRAEKIVGFSRGGTAFGVCSAHNVKRLYAIAGNSLALGTLIFESSIFCGIAFIACGFNGIVALLIRLAVVAAALASAEVYYICSVKKIRSDERIVSSVSGSIDEEEND